MVSFGRYELLALLTKGGLAEIWLARQTGLGGFEKLVVVKRLHERLQHDPEYVDMFLDEARINARLQHTNVLQVYELGEVDGRYFLTMEYVEGLPLGVLAHKCVARLADIPIAIVGGLMTQAAHGLHYAHEATSADGTPMQIVHRDVSPLNMLVSFEGVLKIADFGIAKAEGRRTRTKSGVIKGTPTYMSPEQCTGGDVDRRSDVFALGISLWELLTGRRLFKREAIDATYEAITAGAIPPPSTYRLELPSSLDALTLRALARRPEDRFATAAAFATELETALHREGLRAEVVDVRAFLLTHFAPEHADQEALLSRVRRGTLEPSDKPIFDHAEHGLDSGQTDLPKDPVFIDDDTERDSTATSESKRALAATTPEPDLEPDTLRGKTKTPLLSPPLLSSPPLPAATPPSRGTSPFLIAIIVALAVFAAAMIGLVMGRHTGTH